MSTSDDFKKAQAVVHKYYKYKRYDEGRKFTKTKRELKDLPYNLVVLIDFGSTFSGYTFSTKFDYKISPVKVSTVTWGAPGNALSHKTPTCILFQDDETFHSFGFDAQNKYEDLMARNQHHNWFFFQRFKMHLFERKDISRDMKLKASNGREMKATKVFTNSLRFLKDHLMENAKSKGADLITTEIRWVLTISAIWNDKAKQFMKECAIQAGIPGPQLVLSLEAEAAALFCKYLNVSELAVGQEDFMSAFKPGSQYVVVYVGEGTFNVTVYEVLEDLKLKELYMTRWGEWGGTMVDSAFEEFLIDILGKNVMDTFKQENAADYLVLNRTIEIKKRSIALTTELKITFTLPMSLLDTYEALNPNDNITNRITSMPKYAKDFTWKMDKLKIRADLAKDLFKRSVQSDIDPIIKLLKEPQVEHIAAILWVGDYCKCPLVQEVIKEQFPQKRVVIPAEADLAVSIGAVVNGHELEAVKERRSRRTYGVGTTCKFEPGKHDEKYKFEDEQGNVLCNYIFCKHVEIGEPILVGLRGYAERYYVLDEIQTELSVTIYISKNPDPKYIFEEGCEKLGELIISMTDTSKGLNRGVDVEFTFGGIELEVEAFDIHTGKAQTAYFNFL